VTISRLFAGHNLDAAGILPSAEEVETFLADKSPTKTRSTYRQADRSRRVRRLLGVQMVRPAAGFVEAPQFHRHVEFLRLDPPSVKAGQAVDQFANEIFFELRQQPRERRAQLFVLHKDPIDLAETSTEAFLGQRITCARCHNHPLEKWTQKQYYQNGESLHARGNQERERSRRQRGVRQNIPVTSCIRGC